MTTQAESELDKFVARSNWAYEQRLAGVKRLSMSDIEGRTQYEFENHTAERAAMRDELEMVALLRDLSDFRARTRENALKQQAQIEKNLEVASPVAVPRDKIMDLRKAFAQLSEELTTEEWLKFAVAYGKEVQDSVRKLEAAVKETEKKAKSAEAKAVK